MQSRRRGGLVDGECYVGGVEDADEEGGDRPAAAAVGPAAATTPPKRQQGVALLKFIILLACFFAGATLTLQRPLYMSSPVPKLEITVPSPDVLAVNEGDKDAIMVMVPKISSQRISSDRTPDPIAGHATSVAANLLAVPTALQKAPTEVLLSAGATASASVRGNLGPPSVVTSAVVGDWLGDRWQAAKNMKGEAIPGVHWLDLQLGVPAYNLTIIIDYESAYSDDYIIEIYCRNGAVRGIFKSPGGKKTVSKSKQHVVHEILLSTNQASCHREKQESKQEDYIANVRLNINTPAERWGTSVWSFLVWGYAVQ